MMNPPAPWPHFLLFTEVLSIRARVAMIYDTEGAYWQILMHTLNDKKGDTDEDKHKFLFEAMTGPN